MHTANCLHYVRTPCTATITVATENIGNRTIMHHTRNFLLLSFAAVGCSDALPLSPASEQNSRRSFISAASAAAAVYVPLLSQVKSAAADEPESEGVKISDADLKEIVKSDLVDKQFLVTGDLTKSIYKPTATFTDEIDTYGMDQWVKGTQKLFVGSKSDVRLVGDVEVTKDSVEFRFDEDLMFNIPFKPVVSLTGRLVLTRDETGLIAAYREYWDQDVATVLKSTKFK